MQGEIEQNITKLKKTQKTGILKFYDFHLSSGEIWQECIPVGCNTASLRLTVSQYALDRGKSAWGRGGVCLGAGQTPPCGQTDRCENMSLRKLSFTGGNEPSIVIIHIVIFDTFDVHSEIGDDVFRIESTIKWYHIYSRIQQKGIYAKCWHTSAKCFHKKNTCLLLRWRILEIVEVQTQISRIFDAFDGICEEAFGIEFLLNALRKGKCNSSTRLFDKKTWDSSLLFLRIYDEIGDVEVSVTSSVKTNSHQAKAKNFFWCLPFISFRGIHPSRRRVSGQRPPPPRISNWNAFLFFDLVCLSFDLFRFRSHFRLLWMDP